MPALAELACIFSVVQNATGQRRHFPFIPPHGRTLNPDEMCLIFGHVWHERSASPGRNWRMAVGLARAISNGELRLLSVPIPVQSNSSGPHIIIVDDAGAVKAVPGQCLAS